jgi:hypothetical protein
MCLKHYNTKVRRKGDNVNMHEEKKPIPSSDRREKNSRAELKYLIYKVLESRQEKWHAVT